MLSKQFKKNNKGFTLIELLVAISITTLLVFMVSDYIIVSFRSTTFNDEQQSAITSARKALSILKKEVRGANSSEQGDYPLNNTDEDSFVFFSDVDNDDVMEKVLYFVENSELLKVVTEVDGTNNYTISQASTSIAHYVNNQEEPIFKYYDGNQNETSVINEIRLIKFILKINVTPWRAPNDYYVETSVNIRNLKDNL